MPRWFLRNDEEVAAVVQTYLFVKDGVKSRRINDEDRTLVKKDLTGLRINQIWAQQSNKRLVKKQISRKDQIVGKLVWKRSDQTRQKDTKIRE